MTQISHFFGRRRMRGKIRAVRSSPLIPMPIGDEPVSTPGADPDRILLIGNGLLAGVGVSDHHDAVAGHLSREFSARTGRPAKVGLLVDVELHCADLPAFLDGHDLSGYDAVVVLVGATDAIETLPEPDWRRQIGFVVDELDVRVPTQVDVLLVGISAPSSLTVLRLPVGGPADSRAEAFNALTRKAARQRFRYVPPPFVEHLGPASLHPDGEHDAALASDGYRSWAHEIADELEFVRSHNRTWGG